MVGIPEQHVLVWLRVHSEFCGGTAPSFPTVGATVPQPQIPAGEVRDPLSRP